MAADSLLHRTSAKTTELPPKARLIANHSIDNPREVVIFAAARCPKELIHIGNRVSRFGADLKSR